MSFRSTEFIDDSARDTQATNKLEIQEKGWAFGQIADMKAWYEALVAGGEIPTGAQFTVTGYSLGAHLATAFNQLMQEAGQGSRISATYTFNGAGVGDINDGSTLTQVIQTFSDRRAQGSESFFKTSSAHDLYVQLRSSLNNTTSAAVLTSALATVSEARGRQGMDATTLAELTVLYTAISRAKVVLEENLRVKAGIPSGSTSNPPAPAAQPVDVTQIAAIKLDYQLAVLIAARDTTPYRTSAVVAGYDGYVGRHVTDPIPNFYDVYGDATPSAVTNSQWHRGTPTPVFIEDQPLLRGWGLWNSVTESARYLNVKLLTDNFAQNDFGDTHSLVLLVDSLSIQSMLSKLQPSLELGTLTTMLKTASNLWSSWLVGTQGKAEGDVLENVLNAMRRLFLGPSAPLTAANLEGGTWADMADRNVFYGHLKELMDSPAFLAAIGKATVTFNDRNVAAQARTSFGALASLLTLSPVTVTSEDPDVNTKLQAVWGQTYTDWLDDKNMSQAERDAGNATYSDAWIADRALLVNALTIRNMLNAASGLVADVRMPKDRIYDFRYGANTLVAQKPGNVSELWFEKIAFGDDTGETLGGLSAEDHLYGGGGDDTINGLGGNDHLEGNAGADKLDGGAGKDELLGGAGDDTLVGGTENDLLFGGRGVDIYRFTKGDGADSINDSGGDGFIEVADLGRITGEGAKKIANGVWLSGDKKITYTQVKVTDARSDLVISFNDRADTIRVEQWSVDKKLGLKLADTPLEPLPTATLVGDFVKKKNLNGTQYLIGSDGNYVSDGAQPGAADLINGTAGADVILGLDGDDAMLGRAGDDRIEGGNGNDVLQGGLGRDTLNGGSGNDVIYGSSNGWLYMPVDTSYQAPQPVEPVVLGQGFTWVIDSDGVDGDGIQKAWLHFNVNRDEEQGDDGNLIDGGAGQDFIFAGTGSDLVHGGDDNDAIVGMGKDDVLFGDGGNDRIQGDGPSVNEPGLVLWTPADQHGRDIIDGGAGNDVLLGQGNDDMLFGGADDDRMWGDDRSATDTPASVHGNDYLNGGGGADTMFGGGRDDQLFGGAGNDQIWGDDKQAIVPVAYQGQDSLYGEGGNDVLTGGGNDDKLFGGADDDRLYGDDAQGDVAGDAHGRDLLDGGEGNDTLVGGGSDDILIGGAGNDILRGDDIMERLAASFNGADYLEGGSGNDTLYGDGGDDTLVGGTGVDVLSGGAGNDLYLFSAGDSAAVLGGEVIDDAVGVNTVMVMGAQRPTAVSTDGNKLIVEYANDRLTINNGVGGAVKSFTFDDKTYRYSELIGTFSNLVVQGADSDGHSVVAGSRFGETLWSFSGNATISGGQGDDGISASGGGNTFIYSLGDGRDSFNDAATDENGNAVAASRFVFGTGITSADITLSLGVANTLAVRVGGADSGEVATINHFRAEDALNAANTHIDTFVFDGGLTLTHAQLMARGFDLQGTEGGDTIGGTSVEDRITGGQGDDVLDGGLGSNTYFFNLGDGHDTIEAQYAGEQRGIDTLRLGPGISAADVLVQRGPDATGELTLVVPASGDSITLRGWSFDNGSAVGRVEFDNGVVWSGQDIADKLGSINGTGSDDVIWGSSYSERFDTGAGDDAIYARDGNNVLQGGSGMDFLSAGSGDDVYVFSGGDGRDGIADTGGADVIRFDASITEADVDVTNDGIRYGLNDKIIVNHPSGQTVGDVIERVEFANGTIWTGAQLQVAKGTGTRFSEGLEGTTGNDTLRGLGGDDTLIGRGGNDVLDGGRGADSIYGGDSDDVYVWRVGDGNDRLWDAGGQDTLRFDASVTPADVRFRAQRDSASLFVELVSTGERIEIQGWYHRSINRLDRFEFTGGTIWTAADVDAMLANSAATVGSDDLYGTEANDVLHGLDGDDFIRALGGDDVLHGDAGADQIYAGEGNDVLDGGAGDNDVLVGESGNDTYVFAPGSGRDWVTDVREGDIGNNVVRVTGVAPSDVVVSRDMDNLYLVIKGTGDRICLQAWFWQPGVPDAPDARRAFRVEFDGGIVWSALDLEARLDLRQASNADDVWFGTSGGDSVSMLGGNDVVTGNDGDDALDGGAGDDELNGNAGFDVLHGGEGSDYLMGSTESNFADGGAGNDSLDAYESGAGAMSGGRGNDWIGTAYSTGGQIILFNRGDGSDTLDIAEDDGLGDVLSLGGGLTLNGIFISCDASSNDIVISLGGADSIRLQDWASFAHRHLTLQVVSTSSVDTYDLTAALVDFNAAYAINPQLGHWSAQSSLASYSLGSSANQAWGGELAYRYAMDGSLANVPDSLVQQLLVDTGFGVSMQGFHVVTPSIVGTSGADTLTGTPGADVMAGGGGDDTYLVDTGDVVIERPGEGIDTVVSGVSWTLADNVERLTLTGGNSASGTGNALNNVLKGNAGYNLLDGGGGADTMAGGAGGDTYVVDSAGDVVVELADEGYDLVKSSISYVLTDNVESLTLTGNTAINGTGNALNNALEGNDAANVLDGGIGRDRFAGGKGDDTYLVDDSAENVVENAGEGTDTVMASVSYQLSDNVERLVLTGVQAYSGVGNALDNHLTGNAIANSLDGGAGADTLAGQGGNDTYFIDNSGDVIIENPGEGIDVAQARASYALDDNVENLILLGSSAINGTGNAFDNVITGNSAANVLRGRAGNDTYMVNAGDTVIEEAGEGIDTVVSSVSWILSDHVDNLTLTGGSSVSGTGNALNNVLNGNTGYNLLDGGAGADTMRGDDGGDTYIVDNALDVVIESLNAGSDLVKASVSYRLSDNVEYLVLTGDQAIDGTGNALANQLTGNMAANVLDGGVGADRMAGSGGDDTYIVEDTGDRVIENAGEGIDTVKSRISHVLAANVENLLLTGSDAIDGTGNALDNKLVGNGAANVLRGGAGNDSYEVNAGDAAIENANEGVDTVISSVAWTLGDNVENLTLTGGSSIGGTGNALDNIIVGNRAYNTLIGGAGADVLDGQDGVDTLDGGIGNDRLIGGAGGDVYRFDRGYGVDTIQENDATANVKDMVAFGAGFARSDLQAWHNGDNLEITFLNDAADRLVLQGWYTGQARQVEEFRFADSSSLSAAQVESMAQQLTQMMSTFSAPSSTDTTSSMSSSTMIRNTDLVAPVA